MESSFYEAWDVAPDFLKLSPFLDMETSGGTVVFAMIFLIRHCTTSLARLRNCRLRPGVFQFRFRVPEETSGSRQALPHSTRSARPG